MASIATSFLSEELNAEITLKKLEVVSFSKIELKDIVVKDQQRDTLLLAANLTLETQQPIYKTREFEFKKIKLEEALFKLQTYADSSRSNLWFIIDYFQPSNTEQSNDSKPFTIPEIEVRKLHFSFNNHNKVPTGPEIDFNHISTTLNHLQASNLFILKDTIRAQIHQASLRESTGFSVDSLNCFYHMDGNHLSARNLNILTPQNNLNLDLKFDFESYKDFSDFINKVKVKTTIRPSVINLREVGHFANLMFNMNNLIRLSGDISGTVNNFKAKDLKFAYGSETQFRGNVQMNGLPDITETFTHLSITQFQTRALDLQSFNLPLQNSSLPVPPILETLKTVLIRGKFTGFYNDFVSYAYFKSSLGIVETDLLLKLNKNQKIAYNGHLKANDFDLGKFTGVGDNIGEIDFSTEISGSGTEFQELEIYLKGKVDSLGFYGLNYNDILLDGRLENKKFIGDVSVNDDLVQFDFKGFLDYSGTIPSYDFTASVKNAYLSKINLINRHPSARLSTQLNINLLGNTIDNLQGIATIDSTWYYEEDQTFHADKFSLSLTRGMDAYDIIRIYSDVLDASVEGQFVLQELPKQFTRLVNIHFDTLIANDEQFSNALINQDFIFQADLKQTSDITNIFFPDWELAPVTSINGNFNSRNNLFRFNLYSPEIKLKGLAFRDTDIDIFSGSEQINCEVSCGSLFLTDTIHADSLKLQLAVAESITNYQLQWQDYDERGKLEKGRGKLKGRFAVLSPTEYHLEFEEARMNFVDTTWIINPDNSLHIDSNRLVFNRMGFSSGFQQIMLEGTYSDLPTDTLDADFENFTLSNFDLIYESLGFDIDGTITGDLKAVNTGNDSYYLADLFIYDFGFNNEPLGDARLLSQWLPNKQAFNIDGTIIYTGKIGRNEVFGIEGFYYPNRKNENFDIQIGLNKYKLATLDPFISSFASELDGYAGGSISVKGSMDKPEISGFLDVDRVSMRIDYTNIKYYFADRIIIEPNAFKFNNIVANDSLNNEAIVNGMITHNNLKDFDINLDVSTTKIAGLKTTRKDNAMFYGDALASGSFKISGPINNLGIDLNVRSERGTSIKIPISYETDVGSNDYIVFINQEETESEREEKLKKLNADDITMNIGLDVTNDADIQMYMPYSMGTLKSRGNGDLRMRLNREGAFTMEGEYFIDRGSFLFTLQNIIYRNFDIQRGSKVTWTGDPYDAVINLKAKYKIKTSLGDFAPPGEDSLRVPVDCIIALSDKLTNPKIRFTVEFPDLKEDTKQFIYSRLDTSDQALMSQQMISLLVLNNFSSGSGYSGNVSFNTFSLITNQLNNWLSQISNDFDIGVNYRPGDDITAQEVEVALSTQLWNNRVIIDGNVGIRGEQQTQNTNSLVGEVNVELKITPDGKFRAKAFNKSNNNYLYRNYAPYTQGVGVFYTHDFDKFSDLFRNRKKKAEQDQNLR